MERITVKDARRQLKHILDRVESGEEVILTRRGKDAVRLLPATPSTHQFPDMSAFRAKFDLKGESVVGTVIRERRESRY